MQLRHVPASAFQRLLAQPASPARTAAFATLARLNTLYAIMRAGSGHLGSSFSAMDLVAWLHLDGMDREGDVYFSSKGHDAPGLYAVLGGMGRLPFDSIHQLRRLGGLPGHPDVGTPHMPFNTGSLGMGISKAKGLLHAARLDGRAARCFVLTGDGELQEGQNWEALSGAANAKLGELTVIVDHNKIQSDTWVRLVSDLGDLEAKFRSFGWEVARCDGHDLAALAGVFARFAGISDRPKILIADTVKGRGVSFMEHVSLGFEFELYKFHSGAPGSGDYDRAAAELIATANAQAAALGLGPLELEEVDLPDRTPPSGQRLVGAYSKALVSAAQRDAKLVALDADLVLDTGLIPFKEAFPERFLECGIAEQDMVSQAGALALAGWRPVVHSFACFLSSRPNEQIFNNATELSRVVYVGSLAGLLPGMPGHSHQCVRDISALAGVPGLELIEPACEAEVGPALDYCLNTAPGSTYLRLVSVPREIPYELPADHRLVRGRGTVLREGNDVVVIGYGPVLLPEAWRAAETLAGRGVSVKLVNLPWLNVVDDAWLRDTVRGARRVVALDNHFVTGGQGGMIAAALGRAGSGIPVRLIGVEEIPKCGTNDEVLRAHGLDAASLADRIAGE